MNGRTARAGAAIALVAAAYAGPGATATAAGNPPEINYMLHCQGCHLPGGIGHPGIVPKMQGEIGAFLNWMLPAFDKRVNADFTRYTAEEVARYRETQLTNVSSVRRAILSGDSTAE